MSGLLPENDICGQTMELLNDLTLLQQNMTLGSANWTEALSAIAGIATAVLALVAVGVSIFLARVAGRQAERIAHAQEQREADSRRRERQEYVLERGKAALTASRTILAMLSPRLSELLAEESPDEGQLAVLRKELRALLAGLGLEVSLLRTLDVTLGCNDSTPASGVSDLLNEAAWMETDANHLAFLAFDRNEEGREVDLESDQSVIDALLNGSFVNLNTLLLAECADFHSESVPAWSEPGSPWPEIYRKRKEILLGSSVLRGSWRPESLADAAARALALSCARFEDSLVSLVGQWALQKRML